MAAREFWDHLESDGAVHAVYWVAEWPRSEVHPKASRIDGILNTRLLDGLNGCSDGVADVQARVLKTTGVWHVFREVEVFHFRGELRGEVRRVEVSDRIDSTGTLLDGVPHGIDRLADRGDATHSGDNNSTPHGHFHFQSNTHPSHGRINGWPTLRHPEAKADSILGEITLQEEGESASSHSETRGHGCLLRSFTFALRNSCRHRSF